MRSLNQLKWIGFDTLKFFAIKKGINDKGGEEEEGRRGRGGGRGG